MKRIAELSGKLGYLVIMSKSEKDNKSRRVQATLSRSDYSLGRIRTNWILMRHVLVECKKTLLNSNFIRNWEIQIQTAIPSNTLNKTWKGDKTVPYIGRFILSVCPFWLLMHTFRVKGGTFIDTINYQLTSIDPAICTPGAALHPWRTSLQLIGTSHGSFAEDLTAINICLQPHCYDHLI